MNSSTQQHGYVAVAVGDRLVHYVQRGHGPVLVLQHASPGDWHSLSWLVDALSDEYCVVALDTPGHGLSDPIMAAEPEIDTYGQALLETLSALGVDRVHLYGTHTGAKVALAAATAQPDRFASLTLDGIGVSSDAERADQLANYTPTWIPQSDGSHLIQAWHQARNMFLFWPWYTELPDHALVGAMPSIADLHDVAHGMIRAGERYRLAYRAAFRCDPSAMLAALTVPTLIAAAPDDPLNAHLDRIGSLPALAQLDAAPLERAPRAQWLRSHLSRHGDPTVTTDQAFTALTATARRRFVRTALGDVHVSLPDSGAAVDTVLLTAGVADPGPDWATTAASTMVIDLPGTGRSTLTEGVELTVSSLADAVRVACQASGATPQLVRGAGIGSAVTDAAAAHLSAHAEPSAAAFTSSDLPDLTPRPDGAHLLAAWHLLRDAALHALTTTGRWPGGGELLDLDVIQAGTVSVTGSWQTLPKVLQVCQQNTGQPVSVTAVPTAAHPEPGVGAKPAVGAE